jgi:F1F0 ATPase subunit 2
MNDILELTPSLLEGFLLGSLFYLGLRLTVEKGLSSRNPALWFSISMFTRIGLAISGFYLIARDDWKKIVLCLVGFTLARIAAVGITRHPIPNESPKK